MNPSRRQALWSSLVWLRCDGMSAGCATLQRTRKSVRIFLVRVKKSPYVHEIARLEEEPMVFLLRREAAWTTVPVHARLLKVCA